MEIFLIRHTTPLIDKGICYGQTDIPLAESFGVEAEKLLQLIPENLDAVFTSPLTRCIELARLVNANQLIVDSRLMEMNFGAWEMQKWDDINAEELNNWMQDFVNVSVPNGESFIDLHTRVSAFIEALKNRDFHQIAIVSHAGAIRSFVSNMLGNPLNKAFEIKVNYGSVTKVDTITKSVMLLE